MRQSSGVFPCCVCTCTHARPSTCWAALVLVLVLMLLEQLLGCLQLALMHETL